MVRGRQRRRARARRERNSVVLMGDVEARMAQSIAYSQKEPRAICACEHTGDGSNSDHLSGGFGAAGHGRCTVEGCPCEQFTWVAFTPAFRAHLKKGAN